MSVALVGELALWVALLLAAWGSVVSTLATQTARADLARSGSRAAQACTLFLLVALLALWMAIVRTEPGVVYVTAHAGLAATLPERVIALWAGVEGALVVMALSIGLVTSIATAIATRPGRGQFDARTPVILAPAAAVVGLVMLGILITLLVSALPFVTAGPSPADGRGLAPPFRHVAMLVVWPLWTLAVGAAGAACALAAAAALAPTLRALDLVSAAENWARGAWVLLTASLLIAMWWSYRTTPDVRAWLAAALPPGAIVVWLLLVAFLVPSARHRLRTARGRMVALAVPLPILLASPLAGVAGSWDPLHGLGHRASGAWWIVAIAALVLALAFIFVRSRPLTSLPAAAWHAGRDALHDLGRRLMIVGVVLLTSGLAAGVVRRDTSLALSPGAPATVEDRLGREWHVVYQGPSVRDGRHFSGAPRFDEMMHPVAIGRGAGESIVVSRVRQHVDAFGRPTAPPWAYRGIEHGVLQDVIVAPDSIADADTLHVRIAFVPLVSLIWLGGITLLAGGAMVGHALRVRAA